MGPRAGLDWCGKSRYPHRHLIHGPSSRQLVAIPTGLYRLCYPGPHPQDVSWSDAARRPRYVCHGTGSFGGASPFEGGIVCGVYI